MRRAFLIRLTVLASVALAACSTHPYDAPGISGPSEFSQSVSVTATPDSITQDGFSQSAIVITARAADGQALPDLQVQLTLGVAGSSVAFGTLSSATVFTGSDGKARATYTAPIASPFLAGGPGRLVAIVATAVGSNFATAVSQAAEVLVTPPAALPAAAGAPIASLSYAPAAPKAGDLVSFDASTSQPASGRRIVTYSWDFGDHLANDEHGSDASHAYPSAGSYTVVLGVVDDLGRVGSAIRTIAITN